MTIIAPLSVEVSFMFMAARNKTKRKLCSHELDYSGNGNSVPAEPKCRQTDRVVADAQGITNVCMFSGLIVCWEWSKNFFLPAG